MSAGFRWTVDSQPRVLVLNKPMAFEPAPAHRKNRWTVDSLDLSAHEVVSIASGRAEVESGIKFERNAPGLLDMMEAAADGHTITYYPDLSNGTGYALWAIGMVDGEVGLRPMPDRWSLGDYEVRIRWRDASASGTSLVPLYTRYLLRLDAGHFPLGYSMTRSGTVGPYIDSDGVLKSAAENVARIEWVDLDGDGARETPGLLLETSRANFIGSDDFTAWTDQSTCAVTSSVSDPAGGTGAYTLTGDGGATAEARYLTPTFTGDAAKSVVFVVKESSMPASGNQRLAVYDQTAAAFRLNLEITSWSDGEPQITASTGTLFGTRLIGDGWWAVYGGTTTVTASNSNRVYVYSNVAASAGAISVYRVNAFNASVPPASILDASETRNDDTFYAPFTAKPQAMTVYVKFVELGTYAISSARLFQIGAATGSNDPRFNVYNDVNGDYVVEHDNGTTVVGSVIGSGPSFGDVVEIRAVLNADGSVTGGQSINSGAEATSSNATTAMLGSAWADTRIYLNSRGTSDRGFANFLSVKAVAGLKTMAEMRSI